ncbi:MAG: nitrate ABC transporter permease [Dehalococcoidia bacterium]|nr:nitrate ABC transporter permease [Dehalococcoidia bacterium]
MKRKLTWIPSIFFVIVLLIVWDVLVRINDVPSWLLPSPSEIFKAMLDNARILTSHTITTLIEVILGFVIALFVGLLLSSAITLSSTIEKSFYPFIIASQTIPVIVIAPMLLVWVGYGLMPKIIVVALISFFPIVVNTVDGMKSIDMDLEKLFRTMGASNWDIFRKIRIPNSLPYMFSGLRVAISISVIGAVIGEWVGSSEGLGYLMIRSKPQFQTELVFAAIFILSIMGIILFFGIGLVEKLCIPWNNFRKGDNLGK